MTVFSAKDVFGTPVILYKSRWEEHIIPFTNHPEMAGNEFSIQKTVEEPISVYRNELNPEHGKMFYSKRPESTYPYLYIRVIVDYREGFGNVRTAHFCRTIQGVSSEGLLYDKKKNR